VDWIDIKMIVGMLTGREGIAPTSMLSQKLHSQHLTIIARQWICSVRYCIESFSKCNKQCTCPAFDKHTTRNI